MIKYAFLETKQRSRCQRCGGQLIRWDDEINCLQCGAPHTEEGKLATYSAQELKPHSLMEMAESLVNRQNICTD